MWHFAPEIFGLVVALALLILLIANIVSEPAKATCYSGNLVERQGSWTIVLRPTTCQPAK